MTTTRSYRGARSVDEAVVELIKCKGTQFDPHMVDAMVEALADTEWQPVDTSAYFDGPQNGVPNYASDDDDPTAAEVLASHRPSAAAPRPAQDSDSGASSGQRGETR